MKFTFQTPTRLIFGSGRLDALGDEKLPGKKALLLTSRGKSAERTGALERTMKAVSYTHLPNAAVISIVLVEAAALAAAALGGNGGAALGLLQSGSVWAVGVLIAGFLLYLTGKMCIRDRHEGTPAVFV